MSFQPGNTYGKGRQKGSGRNQICKAWAEKAGGGLQRLLDLAEGKNYKVGVYNGKVVKIGPTETLQFEALKLALAYGLGKPTEHVDVSTGGESLYDFLRAEFSTNGNGNGHHTNGAGK